MKSSRALAQLRRDNPVPPGQEPGAPWASADTSLLTSILGSTPHGNGDLTQELWPVAPMASRGPGQPGRRRPTVLAVAASIGVAVLVSGIAVVGAGLLNPATALSPAAQQRAASSPLLLVTAPGWSVTRVDEYVQYATDTGEMTFTSAAGELTLSWRPIATHQQYLNDRAASAPPDEVDFGGHNATMFKYPPGGEFTALWAAGRFSLELRGASPSSQEFLTVADTVRPVDEATWLAALPADAVAPDERSSVVESMLSDIPIPPGLDTAALGSSGRVSDRYQLGANVAGYATCGWIQAWQLAQTNGDAAALQTAAAALASSHQWQILVEMNANGGYSEVVWEYADTLTADPSDPTAVTQVLSEYRTGLGCPA